jgi:hypothetical protein
MVNLLTLDDRQNLRINNKFMFRGNEFNGCIKTVLD